MNVLSPFRLVNAIRSVDRANPVRLRFAFEPTEAAVSHAFFDLSSSEGSEVRISMFGTGV
jgi:hypothetical protein